MSETLIESLLEELGALRAGDRAWFWLCPALEGLMPPLLLQPLRSDPEMAALRAQAVRQPVPVGARALVGLANVDAQGRLSLGGPGLSAAMLSALAGWAVRFVGAFPELARLKGTTMLNVVDGVVAERHDDPALWAALPDLPAPGTVAALGLRLSRLKPGRSAWFWITDTGPGGAPHAALGNPRRDPDGKLFAARVAEIRRQAPSTGAQLQGLLQVSADGRLSLTTATPLAEAQPIVQALLAAHGGVLAPLAEARLVQLRGGQVVAAEALAPGVDLQKQASALGQLAAGAPLRFWFTHQGADGQPLLLLDADSGALRDAARAARGTGGELRGKVEKTPRGWLHFQTKTDDTDFLAALAGWATGLAGQEPALAALRGARVTVRGPGDDIAARYRNDALWDGL